MNINIEEYEQKLADILAHDEDLENWQTELSRLEDTIDYKFINSSLLKLALIHRSYLHKKIPEMIAPSERLEFLGDAVLGHIVVEYLFYQLPEENEGSLTKLKSKIISKNFLFIQAEKIKLEQAILMSEEEKIKSKKEKFSLIADSMESLIAAIYIDSGYESVKNFITNFILYDYQELLQNDVLIDFKSNLQEYVQQNFSVIPKYVLAKESGPGHNKTFEIAVNIKGKEYGKGKGKTKKQAEQNAAKATIEKLCIEID